MQTAQYEQWLRATRQFWDVASEFDARYRRICASTEYLDTDDEEVLRELWAQDTAVAIERVLDRIPLAPDWVCVEIGCGIGRLLKPIAQRCRAAIGVDISETMVQYSNNFLADTPNARVHVNDGSSLGMIADSTVDFVYSHLAFQHITRYEIVESYLAEIARVLKPGGYLRVQILREAAVPVVEQVKNMVRPLLHRGKFRSNLFDEWREGKPVKFGGVTFTPREWRQTLRRHGLRTVATQLGLGHDCWMWTTSVNRSAPSPNV